MSHRLNCLGDFTGAACGLYLSYFSGKNLYGNSDALLPFLVFTSITLYCSIKGYKDLKLFVTERQKKSIETKLDPAFEALLEKIRKNDFSGPDFSLPRIDI